MTRHACEHPVPLELALAWLAGELDGAAEGALEERLFACGGCAASVEGAARIAAAVRGALAAGALGFPLTPALGERLASAGLRVRVFRAAEHEVVACGAAVDDDVVLTVLPAAIPAGARATLVIESPIGRERHEDIPVDRARGELGFASPGAWIRAIPPGPVRLEVWASDGGTERRVAAYALEHGRWPR